MTQLRQKMLEELQGRKSLPTTSETNNLRNTLSNPIAHRARRKRQRLRPNPPIASSPADNTLLHPQCSAPAHLSIGH
jgi:hypothetical protein